MEIIGGLFCLLSSLLLMGLPVCLVVLMLLLLFALVKEVFAPTKETSGKKAVEDETSKLTAAVVSPEHPAPIQQEVTVVTSNTAPTPDPPQAQPIIIPQALAEYIDETRARKAALDAKEVTADVAIVATFANWMLYAPQCDIIQIYQTWLKNLRAAAADPEHMYFFPGDGILGNLQDMIIMLGDEPTTVHHRPSPESRLDEAAKVLSDSFSEGQECLKYKYFKEAFRAVANERVLGAIQEIRGLFRFTRASTDDLETTTDLTAPYLISTYYEAQVPYDLSESTATSSSTQTPHQFALNE